jgi:hydrogenase maturation factor HypF (carbamoyltransferase family)
MRRRVEIVAFEHERIIEYSHPNGHIGCCPVCGTHSQLLTTAQAALVSNVASKSIRRWLAQGKAHSVKTAGGQHRVCRESLFSIGKKNTF